jgi:hypothetical protein
VAEDAFSDIAAEQRTGIHQRQERAVSQVGGALAARIATVKLGDDVKHQRPAYAVKREALPKLGHEQHPQRTRVAHDLLEFGDLALIVA